MLTNEKLTHVISTLFTHDEIIFISKILLERIVKDKQQEIKEAAKLYDLLDYEYLANLIITRKVTIDINMLYSHEIPNFDKLAEYIN